LPGFLDRHAAGLNFFEQLAQVIGIHVCLVSGEWVGWVESSEPTSARRVGSEDSTHPTLPIVVGRAPNSAKAVPDEGGGKELEFFSPQRDFF
jgi:hypothetical protein